MSEAKSKVGERRVTLCAVGAPEDNILRQPVFVLFRTAAFLRAASSWSSLSLSSAGGLIGVSFASWAADDADESIFVDASLLATLAGSKGVACHESEIQVGGAT